MKLKILIADDHALFRQGLRALLATVPDFEIVAEAGDGETALRLARQLLPDVVIMDMMMPTLNGIQATSLIFEELEGVRVLALSMEVRKDRIMEALRAGAAGYLTKETDLAELTTAIRAVAGGDLYLPEKISALLLKNFMRQVPVQECSRLLKMTERERSLLQLVADGKNSKEIAHAFNISVKTVDNHRSSIMKKLDIYNTADLTKFAIREGLSSL